VDLIKNIIEFTNTGIISFHVFRRKLKMAATTDVLIFI